MPRSARFILPNSYYHIITRGNNGLKVFRVDEDYQYYLNLVRKYRQEVDFDLFHYCLIPNHVHLLIRTGIGNDFSVFMKKLNLSYYYHYKKCYGWSGHFWQDRFMSQPVGNDGYFIQCGKYIELNAARAGLVEQPEDYPYSSFRHYSKGQPNDLITTDPYFTELANTDEGRRNKYQELVISDLVEKSYTKIAWGSQEKRYHEMKKIKYHLMVKGN